VYKYRFLFTQEDKKSLTEIFGQMSVVENYHRNLSLFKEMDRKDVANKACELWGIELPDDRFRLDFDFQNRVSLIHNKQTQQVLIIHDAGELKLENLAFGKQLIDEFKPKIILAEVSPL
jgi:hypothetical protein